MSISGIRLHQNDGRVNCQHKRGGGILPGMSVLNRYGCVLLVVLAACGSPPDEPESGTALTFTNMEAAYTGDAVCFDCHQEEWVGFQEHGMARSFYAMTPEVAVENFMAAPLHHASSGFYYRVYALEGEFFQEEYRLDNNDAKVHRLTRRMDYVVGSGNAARTYLTESNGRLYEMPLTWYSQVEKWDFSPGYEVYNKRFDRLVPDRCMACHNSFPESTPWVEGKYVQVPQGISCERCHGPGSEHVDFRLAGGTLDGPDLSIVNPAHLERDLQMDVCQQCHLQTTVSVLRDGRGPFDYRPSQRLEDHLAFFTAQDVSTGLDVISHAERLALSACFAASVPAMTCTTCHNPHEGFRDQGPDYFSETCRSCHEVPLAAHEPDWTDCASCHMPRKAADGTPHASFTDHWIRVPERDVESPASISKAMTSYYARDAAAGSRMQAAATLVHGLQQADVEYVELGLMLGRNSTSDDITGELHYLMGHALLELGRAEEAVAPLEVALARNAAVPERLNALALAYEQTESMADSIAPLYRRALNLAPELAEVRLNYGRFLERQGDAAAAVEQYRLAGRERPWLSDAHYNEGTALLRDGDFAAAETALNTALSLQPDHADALGNLGMLLLTENRESEAGELFARAARSSPNNPIALSNFGSWLFNQGRYAESIVYLRQAVAIEPEYLDALVNLALAYAREDQMSQARETAQRVLQLDPQNSVARTIIELTDS